MHSVVRIVLAIGGVERRRPRDEHRVEHAGREQVAVDAGRRVEALAHAQCADRDTTSGSQPEASIAPRSAISRHSWSIRIWMLAGLP